MSNFSVPKEKYMVQIDHWSVDTAADGNGSDLSSVDLYLLAQRDINRVMIILGKMPEDSYRFVSGMNSIPNVDKSVIENLRRSLQQSSKRFQSLNSCADITWQIVEGDKEGIASNSTSPGNCIGYAFADMLPVFSRAYRIDPANPDIEDDGIIMSILKKHYHKILTLVLKKGEFREQFAFRVEEVVLKNLHIREGDIIAIGYNRPDGTTFYAHMGVLKRGRTKRLIIEAKDNTCGPFRSSIATQVLRYGGEMVRVFRRK